jgi:hypothetical protein
MKLNEYVRAATLGAEYWLYVVFDCAQDQPDLRCISDPYRKLAAMTSGDVIIPQSEILGAASPAI